MWRNYITLAMMAVCLGLLADASLTRPQRLCGKHLADTLSIVCNGLYNSKFSKKSDESRYSAGYYSSASADEQPYRVPRYPFIPRTQAASLFVPSRFRRFPLSKPKGIYDECCVKPCTKEEMLTYCSPQATESTFMYVAE